MIRTILRGLLSCLLLFGGSLVAAADELPNIILLMGDDHGWDETGYNGHPHLATPVLDEMAANGLAWTVFTQHIPLAAPHVAVSLPDVTLIVMVRLPPATQSDLKKSVWQPY